MLIWTSQFEIIIVIKVYFLQIEYETIWLIIFSSI
jgi:hypothetical protein